MERLALFDPRNYPQSLADLTAAITDALALDRLRVRLNDDDWRSAFRAHFVSPPYRFLALCRLATERGATDGPPWEDWTTSASPFRQLLARIDREAELWPCVQAHLLCARAAARPDFANELPKIAEETNLSRGFLRMLAAQLCGRSVPVERELTMPVLLVQEEQGLLADLTLKLVKDGRGDWYPAPEMSLVYLHEDFRQGEDAARKYVTERLGLHPGPRDICWSLRLREGERPAELKGPSASAATALLFAKLLAMSDGASLRR